VTVVVHFLTDGKQSFYASGSVVPPATAQRLIDDSISLFQTVTLSKQTGKIERSEDELVGSWTSEDTLPDGRVIVAKTELKPDLSFSTNITAGEKTIFTATGVWSRSADIIYWEYLYSVPPLPNDKRTDEDKILGIEKSEIILQSTLSGKKHSLKRI